MLVRSSCSQLVHIYIFWKFDFDKNEFRNQCLSCLKFPLTLILLSLNRIWLSLMKNDYCWQSLRNKSYRLHNPIILFSPWCCNFQLILLVLELVPWHHQGPIQSLMLVLIRGVRFESVIELNAIIAIALYGSYQRLENEINRGENCTDAEKCMAIYIHFVLIWVNKRNI